MTRVRHVELRETGGEPAVEVYLLASEGGAGAESDLGAEGATRRYIVVERGPRVETDLSGEVRRICPDAPGPAR